MSITDTIKQLVGGGSEEAHLTEYRCTECENTFDSAKPPERAKCMGCLSNEVEPTS